MKSSENGTPFETEALVPQLPSVYRLAYLQTWSAPGAALAAKRAMLCFAAKKSAGTAQEQQTRLFRLALSCGREQRLRAAFGSRNPLSRELTFSAPEAERAFTAVGKINTTQRTVLYLYYNEEYSMAEIAALLHRSEGAVSRALQKAQAALKAELGEQDWKALLQGMFAAIAPEESLRAEVETALARGKTGRSPAVKYAAAGVLALLVVVAFVAAPLLESRPAQGKTGAEAVSKMEAAGRDNLKIYVSHEGGIKGQYFLLSDGPIEFLSSRGFDDGKTLYSIANFNLDCGGLDGIKTVTYRTENCSFVKQAYFSSLQEISGEAKEEVIGGLDGVTVEQDGKEIKYYTGFIPIGTVYSMEYNPNRKMMHFGIMFRFEEQDSGKTAPENTYAKALSDAYNKAGILIEVQMEDGSKVTKRIQFQSTGVSETFWAKETEG